MIQLNKHPDGRISNIVFGLCHIVGGIVRAGSFVFLHTTIPLTYARNQARRRFTKMTTERDTILRSKLSATNADTKNILTQEQLKMKAEIYERLAQLIEGCSEKVKICVPSYEFYREPGEWCEDTMTVVNTDQLVQALLLEAEIARDKEEK